MVVVGKKIKELTGLMLDAEYKDIHELYRAKDSAVSLALKNGCYEQAWKHCEDLFNRKLPDFVKYNGSRELYRARAAYGFCTIMKEIPSDHEFLDYFIKNDPDLIRKSADKEISREYAREFIGRKYLYYAADECGYSPAIIEYALNCIGRGHKNSFIYEYNELSARTGLEWADVLIDSKDIMGRATGYVIYAFYYLNKYQNDYIKIKINT